MLKLPWAESVLGNDEKVYQVCHLVCTKIDSCDKLLTPKLDSLWKHGRRQRAHLNILGVIKNFYTTMDCRHLKNKVLFLAIRRDTIVEQIVAGATLKQKKKIVQFVVIFVLLCDGWPMADYSDMKDLVEYLLVPDYPHKH